MKKLIQVSLVAVLLLSVAFGLFQATRYSAVPVMAGGCSTQGIFHSEGNCVQPNVGWNKGLSWAAPLQIVATVPLVRPMVGWNA